MLKLIPFYASLLGQPLTDSKKSGKVHVLLYGAIEVHAMGHKGCIAGNDTLAEETGTTKSEVRRYLSEMKTAQWIYYTVENGNSRGAITALLQIDLPNLRNNSAPPAEKTTTPLRNNSASTIDNSIGNSVDTSAEAPEEEKKKEIVKISREQVQEIIDAFAPVNESYLSFYGKKTQYDSTKQLIKTYPKEHILAILKVLPDYNKIQYLASYEKIYTPDDLYKKWSVVKDNLIKLKTKRSKDKEKEEILT